MRVFVTGASGHIGKAVLRELGGAGHEVFGLARSDASAAAIENLGGQVVRGDLSDLDVLRKAVGEADGVIHLAFRHDLMMSGDLAGAADVDLAAATAMAEALAGSGKPFVGTSGTGLLSLMGNLDRPGTERDVLPGGYRVDTENFVIGLADQGIRSSVVRLPPTVHSSLDHIGFIPGVIASARAHGYAAYVGDGSNRWPAVHTLDAAHLYRLALDNAPAGTRLHAVDDEAVPFVRIAEAIARNLDIPVRAITPEEATAYFGPLVAFVQLDNPATGALTRELLGWQPTRAKLIADLDEGHYFH